MKLKVSHVLYMDTCMFQQYNLLFVPCRYAWFRMPSWIRDDLSSDMAPYPVPVLVGCAIAVRRSYFFDNGAFDRGLDIWGGEHLELSFRTWLCGGSIWTVPCSRVGHLFKETTFNFEGHNKDLVINKNLRRVAEVWLDEYKPIFYAAIRGISRIPELSSEEAKSLSERKLLRDSLKCKPFSWYLSTIIPELRFPPEKAVHFGEIRNIETGACFRALPDDHIGLHYDCFVHRILPEHEFHITTDRRLLLGESCVDIVPDTLLLRLQPCSTANASWDIRPGPITGQLVSTNANGTLCVTHVTSMVQTHFKEQMPQAATCIDGHLYQQWAMTYMFDY